MEKSGYDTEAETGTTQSTDVDASQGLSSTGEEEEQDRSRFLIYFGTTCCALLLIALLLSATNLLGSGDDPDGGDDGDNTKHNTLYAKVTSGGGGAGGGGGGGGNKTTKAATTQSVQTTKKETTKTKRPPTMPLMTPNITVAETTKAPKHDTTATKRPTAKKPAAATAKPAASKKPPSTIAKPTAPKKPLSSTAKPTPKPTAPKKPPTSTAKPTPKPTAPKKPPTSTAKPTPKPTAPKKPPTSTAKPTPKPTTTTKSTTTTTTTTTKKTTTTTTTTTTKKPTTTRTTTTTKKPTTTRTTTTTKKPTTTRTTTTTTKPTTTTTPTTTTKMVTSTTTVPPLLICTMLWKYPVMIFPPDGTCKYILLDSLNAYVGGAYNNIARGIHKLTKPFLDKGKALKITKLGYGVAHEAFEDFLTDIGTDKGANNFWTLVTPENANFAVLDMNEQQLNEGELQRQLVNLKRVKEFVEHAKKVPMGIIALAVYGKSSDVCGYITKHMKENIIPDVFLSYAHETIFSDSDDDCRILVPQFLMDPHTLSKQLPFGHSIGQAVELLKCVSNAKVQTKLALFVTLNGRYYKAVQGKNVFDKCTMTDITEEIFYHKTTARICSESFVKEAKPLLLLEYETYKLENPKSKELYVVDSPDLLQRKICKVKKDYTDIDYTLAVTRIMGIGEPIPCFPNVFDGDYQDLIFLRNLSGYIDGHFKSPSDAAKCAKFY